MDKTNEIDAFVIANYLQFGRLPMSIMKDVLVHKDEASIGNRNK